MPKTKVLAEWLPVFTHADDESDANPTTVVSIDGTDSQPFSTADVASIAAQAKGSPGGDAWMMIGTLKDDRAFAVRAVQREDGWSHHADHEPEGCGCWSPTGIAYVGATVDAIVAYAVNPGEHDRLGL